MLKQEAKTNLSSFGKKQTKQNKKGSYLCEDTSNSSETAHITKKLHRFQFVCVLKFWSPLTVFSAIGTLTVIAYWTLRFCAGSNMAPPGIHAFVTQPRVANNSVDMMVCAFQSNILYVFASFQGNSQMWDVGVVITRPNTTPLKRLFMGR